MAQLVLQSLVETAMLAAVSGLAYTVATLLKIESYLGYFLPMPVIVAAMRSGPASGRKTMTATCFLLLCKHAYIFSVRSLSWHVLHSVQQLSKSVWIAMQTVAWLASWLCEPPPD